MWNVAGPVGSAKNSVMVSRSSGETRIQTTSETVSRPAGTTVKGDRSKVKICIVPCCTDAPSPAPATAAPAIARGVEPYPLDSLTRRADPPRVTLTTCRTDWLANPSKDQFVGPCPKSGGDAAIIEAVHAAVQRLSCRCVSAPAGSVGRTSDATTPTRATDDRITARRDRHRRPLTRPKRNQLTCNLLSSVGADCLGTACPRRLISRRPGPGPSRYMRHVVLSGSLRLA